MNLKTHWGPISAGLLVLQTHLTQLINQLIKTTRGQKTSFISQIVVINRIVKEGQSKKLSKNIYCTGLPQGLTALII